MNRNMPINKIYIHAGYLKNASSFLQLDIFQNDKRINFHGIIRDHDNVSSDFVQNPIISEFTAYIRGKTDSFLREKELFKIIKNSNSSNINLISEEDFSTCDNISVDEKARRIKEVFPSAKIILVVRSPASLLRSLHAFYFRGGKIKVGLNEWIDEQLKNYEESTAMQTIHYKKNIGSFVEYFGIENVYVLNFEDMTPNIEIFLSKLNEIMGLEYVGYSSKAKRNYSLTAGEMRFGLKHTFLFSLRCYLPQFIKKNLKQHFLKSKVESERFPPLCEKRIEELYSKDIEYLKNEFNIIFQK